MSGGAYACAKLLTDSYINSTAPLRCLMRWQCAAKFERKDTRYAGVASLCASGQGPQTAGLIHFGSCRSAAHSPVTGKWRNTRSGRVEDVRGLTVTAA